MSSGPFWTSRVHASLPTGAGDQHTIKARRLGHVADARSWASQPDEIAERRKESIAKLRGQRLHTLPKENAFTGRDDGMRRRNRGLVSGPPPLLASAEQQVGHLAVFQVPALAICSVPTDAEKVFEFLHRN